MRGDGWGSEGRNLQGALSDHEGRWMGEGGGEPAGGAERSRGEMDGGVGGREPAGGAERPRGTCGAQDLGLVPGSGTFAEEGTGNPLQYSCLQNFMDRRAW